MSISIKDKKVEAIDLGYGFTKFTITKPSGEIKTNSFPSIVVPAGNKSLGGGFLNERDTIEVIHNGVVYEVGKDVGLCADAYSHRVLNKGYIQTNDYAALMKGALKMMGHDTINTLILGAPVSSYDEVKEILISSWKGEIQLDEKKSVRINKVKVLPQPVGGFAYYGAMAGNYEKIINQRNLIIDPGYFTLDWLLTENMILMEGSGSYEGGMNFVINAVVKELGSDANNLETISRIDRFFYKNTPVIFDGKELDMSKYLPAAYSVIEKSIQRMFTKLTDIKNIDNIVVIGGAAEVYLPFIQKQFIGRDVKIAKGKSYSNVLGFKLIGESHTKNKRKV